MIRRVFAEATECWYRFSTISLQVHTIGYGDLVQIFQRPTPRESIY